MIPCFYVPVRCMLPSSGMPTLTQFAPAGYSVIAVFLWGAADFAGGYGSRRANAFVLTAFSHLCAFALMLVIAFAQHGAFPSGASIVWALMAGAIGGFSLAIFYRALASGQMGLTAPIAALLGAAIPTMVDIAVEGSPSRWTVGGFGLAILAIWLITRPEPSHEEPTPAADADQEPSGKADSAGRPAGVAMAALAGVGFAGFYLCVHQASGSPSSATPSARSSRNTRPASRERSRACARMRPPSRATCSSTFSTTRTSPGNRFAMTRFRSDTPPQGRSSRNLSTPSL